MQAKSFWFGFLICFWGAILGYGWNHYSDMQDNKIWKEHEPSKLNNTGHYCYHFTWMGRKFNKWTFKNIKNKTCSQYFKDKKTLCINPMVATYLGGKPDLNYILNNHAAEATCRLSEEHVCVKYTVYYNGIISYETRYCSIINVDKEYPMKSGCLQEKRGSEVIVICACRSQPGPDGICNSSTSTSEAKFFRLAVLFIVYNLPAVFRFLFNP